MNREIKPTELKTAAPAILEHRRAEQAEAAHKVAGEAKAPSSYSEPQPDWLPWHIARFCFLPRFAHPEKDFSRELETLIKKLSVFDHHFQLDITDPGACVIQRGRMTLVVDARDGHFRLDTDGFEGPSGVPEEFFAGDLNPLPEFRDDAEAIIRLSNAIWVNLQERFSRALRDGSAQVYGRWREVDRPFSRIAWDQLLHLEPTLQETRVWSFIGDAVPTLTDRVNGGALVLSPHVAASSLRRRSKGAQDEDDATDALVVEINDNPNAPRSKENVFNSLKARFKGITPEGFKKRIWLEALSRVPESTRAKWMRQGPRARKS